MIDLNVIALQVAERIRDAATDDIPFASGDLRKSIQTEMSGNGKATVGSNLSYARAVHDGRPALTIRPNVARNPPFGKRTHRNKKRARLKFSVGGRVIFAKEVHQPARNGKPFLRIAAKNVQDAGYDFLDRYLAGKASKELMKSIKESIKINASF